MRSTTNRLAAALLAVLLLAAPAMAAPAAPESGHGDAGWSSAFAGVLTDLSNLWDGVVSHFTAASQGTTTDPVSTGTQVGTGFDPDGLTALPPDGGGDVGTGFDPDG